MKQEQKVKTNPMKKPRIKTYSKGLKDHEISELVNALTAGLHSKFHMVAFPKSLRGIVSELVTNELVRQGNRIDHMPKSIHFK